MLSQFGFQREDYTAEPLCGADRVPDGALLRDVRERSQVASELLNCLIVIDITVEEGDRIWNPLQV